MTSTLNIPDHWLWLGLGVFTFLAVKQVSHGLHNIRTLTEVHNLTPQPHTNSPTTAPTHQEDAIKTSSLLTLATSHNTEIRSSATKILCTRFYASASAKKALVRDLNSKDEDVKHRAQLAFNLLCEMGVWREYSVPPPMPRGAWRLLGRREWDLRRDGAERDLRRRRREAMVIHEGEGAVGREDVYMRDQQGMMISEEGAVGSEDLYMRDQQGIMYIREVPRPTGSMIGNEELLLRMMGMVQNALADPEGDAPVVREGGAEDGEATESIEP